MSTIVNHAGHAYLNVGCGPHYHTDWINMDIVPCGPDVIACDLSKGIPLEDHSVDVVYHSHVLEHIRREHIPSFLKECHRVLNFEGTIRVVVPDLEVIARKYIEKLDAAVSGDPAAAIDYEWTMLHLYDQAVREQGGGGMIEYLGRDPLPNEEFVVERLGEEARNIIRYLRGNSPAPQSKTTGQAVSVNGSASPMSLRSRLGKLRRIIRAWRQSDASRLAREVLTSDDLHALAIGQFRLAGEVHQWMYDRHSLRQLLLAVGFRETVQRTASTSRIPEWASFNLDTLPDGAVIRPDSLYMEALA